MTIKLFKDLHEFALVSSMTAADINLLKKYNPDALTIKDGDGNVKFSVSFNKDHSSVAKFGITFGAEAVTDGKAMIIGALPEKEPEGGYGEYIADLVGSALEGIEFIEGVVPGAVEAVKASRAQLIGSIVEG